jgi:hypothetical protein
VEICKFISHPVDEINMFIGQSLNMNITIFIDLFQDCQVDCELPPVGSVCEVCQRTLYATSLNPIESNVKYYALIETY